MVTRGAERRAHLRGPGHRRRRIGHRGRGGQLQRRGPEPRRRQAGPAAQLQRAPDRAPGDGRRRRAARRRTGCRGTPARRSAEPAARRPSRCGSGRPTGSGCWRSATPPWSAPSPPRTAARPSRSARNWWTGSRPRFRSGRNSSSPTARSSGWGRGIVPPAAGAQAPGCGRPVTRAPPVQRAPAPAVGLMA